MRHFLTSASRQHAPLASLAGRWAVGQAVEFPCGADGPLSTLRRLFVVEMGPKVSKGASFKVCCHPASPPLLDLVPV